MSVTIVLTTQIRPNRADADAAFLKPIQTPTEFRTAMMRAQLTPTTTLMGMVSVVMKIIARTSVMLTSGTQMVMELGMCVIQILVVENAPNLNVKVSVYYSRKGNARKGGHPIVHLSREK